METRAHHVLIGLFTVIVVAAGLMFGLWLAKSSVDTAFKDYEIVFNEAVTGLSRGSAVQYSGIKVGDVVQLRLDPEDPRRVLAQIRIAGETPIKEDTQAKLALTGITGTSIIQLSGGTPASPELTGVYGKLPVILASPSPISRLLNDTGDLLSGITQLLHNTNQMFSDDNVKSLTLTLQHMEQATSVVADEREDIRNTLKQLTLVSKQASLTLEQTSALMRGANELLSTDGKQVFVSAQQTLKSIEQSTATINNLLKSNNESINGGMQGLAELGPAVRELRDTLASFRAISRRLEANPSGYLLGSDKNKEFEP
jgi:phospholipid/cholesterol/gamma-HCH transport system substrate-binding protein